MKGILPVFILLFLSAAAAPAAPRIAVVRITEIYAGLPESASITRDTEEETKKIMRDQRADNVRKIIGEMQEIREQLSSGKSKQSNPEEVEKLRKLARSYELKRQQAQTLQKEFETFRAVQQKEIDRVMVRRMRDSLNRIRETTRRIAKERGYDLVLDSTGRTNTNLPFLLYAKAPDDITDTIIAALKDSAPQP